MSQPVATKDRVFDILTRDLTGRRPAKFIQHLDAVNAALTQHLNDRTCYPAAAEGGGWNGSECVNLALAVERWLCAQRPNALFEVVRVGFMERGYRAVRHTAVRIGKDGHFRYIDGFGVFAPEDYHRRLREVYNLVYIQEVENPQKTDLIQPKENALKAVSIFRFLSEKFSADKLASLDTKGTIRLRDIELPDRLYHVTTEGNFNHIKKPGLKASRAGANHCGRSYGTPTGAIYLGANSEPEDHFLQMPERFHGDCVHVLLTLEIDTAALDVNKIYPDPYAAKVWRTDLNLCTASKLRHFLDLKSLSDAEQLYDSWAAATLPAAFVQSAQPLWRWSFMALGSVMYAGDIPAKAIVTHRYHPKSKGLLRDRRIKERQETFSETSDFFRTTNQQAFDQSLRRIAQAS